MSHYKLLRYMLRGGCFDLQGINLLVNRYSGGQLMSHYKSLRCVRITRSYFDLQDIHGKDSRLWTIFGEDNLFVEVDFYLFYLLYRYSEVYILMFWHKFDFGCIVFFLMMYMLLWLQSIFQIEIMITQTVQCNLYSKTSVSSASLVLIHVYMFKALIGEIFRYFYESVKGNLL